VSTSSVMAHRALSVGSLDGSRAARSVIPMLGGIDCREELKDSPSQMEICCAIVADVLELDDQGEPANDKYAERRAPTWVYRYCTGELPAGRRILRHGNVNCTDPGVLSLPSALSSGERLTGIRVIEADLSEPGDRIGVRIHPH
jgi:hypothetical protein